ASYIPGRAIALPSHTRGGSRMRESRTCGSVRGARDETRVPTATCARQSWCDPAGGRPAQVRSSVRLVASVAWPLATVVAKRTQRLHGVWDRDTKDQTSQGPRFFIRSKATCAAPLCEVLTPCRGQRPHHVQKDRIGTWEISYLAAVVACCVCTAFRIGKVRSRSR